MLKRKIQCYLLRLFFVVNIFPPNGGEVLRLNWQQPDQQVKTVIGHTQRLLSGSGAFNYLGRQNNEAFRMLEFTRSTLETNSFLFLIRIVDNQKGSLGTFFYVAASYDEKQVYLNWIGEILKVKSGNLSSCKRKIKYAAELYAQSHYAFQQNWELSEKYKENAINLNVAPSEMLIPTKTGSVHKFYLAKYWIVTPNQEMVVLYANEERTKGAYATVTIHPTSYSPKPEIIRVEAVEHSFASTFDALWKRLDAGLAFERGWNLVPEKIGPFSGKIESEIRNHVHWLPKNSGLALFAQTDEWNGLIGTIWKTSGSYGANTLFAVWNLQDDSLVHVSLLGSLKQTLASYRTYYMMGLWKNITRYNMGMGHWDTGKDPFAIKYWPAIKSALEKSNYRIPNLTISTLSECRMLPNLAHEDYKSTQNICVFVKDQNQKLFPALIKILTEEPDGQSTVTVEDVGLESLLSSGIALSSEVDAGWLVETRYASSLAWIFGAPQGVDISAVAIFIKSESVINTTNILYSFGSSENMLIIIKHLWKNEYGIEYEHVCFIALKKSDNSYKVTWVGQLYLAIGLTTAIKLAKAEAEIYHSKSTFGYDVYWELNLDTVAHPNTQQHCSWGLPDKLHKIQIFREKNKVGHNFWYKPLFKSGDAASYAVGSVGRKYNWIGDVLGEITKYIANPLLYSKLFYSEFIENFLGLGFQQIKEGVEAKYSGNGDFVFETLVCPVDHLTKAVLVFNQKTNENIGIDGVDTLKYSTAPTEAKVLVPLSRSTNTGIAATFQPQGEIIEVKGDWRDSIGTHLLDPLSFTPGIKWKDSKQQFDEKAVDYILYNSPWKANVSKFTIEKVKRIDLSSRHQEWIGNAFYICSLDKNDVKAKFLVVWNHRGNGVTQKLRYVGGLGSTEEVHQDYTRYISSELAFLETGFTHGIANYDQTSRKVKRVLKILQDYLGKAYLEKPKEVDIMTLLESYQFGRISTPHGEFLDDEQIYCLRGNVSKTQPVYATILINVKETMHGVKCLSFRTETTTTGSISQVENDLRKFIEQHHMRRSP